MFFTFPEDASWNANRQAVEFGIEIGEYADTVRVGRRVFQHRAGLFSGARQSSSPAPARGGARETSQEEACASG